MHIYVFDLKIVSELFKASVELFWASLSFIFASKKLLWELFGGCQRLLASSLSVDTADGS